MAPATETVSLILLAAGRSTRFGRPKQLEPVGPRGEALLDITLRDAFDAGCDNARVVTSPKLADHFRERFRDDPRVHIHIQEEPLGTAHAAMIGMQNMPGTCIVVNGDDLYGRSSMDTAVSHARTGDPSESALVAFELGRTLSPHGPVNRAACIAQEGSLVDTQEVIGLHADAQGRIRDRAGAPYDAATPVSMNLWVFRELFNHALHEAWQVHDAAGQEFGLPTAVRAALDQGHRFRVLRTSDQWFGLTFPEDAQLVRDHLRSPDVA